MGWRIVSKHSNNEKQYTTFFKQKIFNEIVRPILLYGSEMMESDIDFGTYTF